MCRKTQKPKCKECFYVFFENEQAGSDSSSNICSIPRMAFHQESQNMAVIN